MRQWVVVVGGTNMDVVARTSAPLVPATSNPGHTRISPGGVGRNIAACLGLLGAPVRLVSAVGDDAFGEEALRVTAECGADVAAVRRVPGATGTYTAVLDDRGELVAAVSDMAVVDHLELDTVHLTDAALVVLDGNLAHEQAARVVASAAAAGVPVAFEPVSVAKAARLADLVRELFLVTPNADEIAALTGRSAADWRASIADLHDRGVEHVWLRQGADGSWMCSRGAEPVHLPAVPAEVVDVTGAGDAMLAAWVAAWLRGADPVAAAQEGHLAAAATIASPHTVRPDLADFLGRDH
ncbi:carbohydrate kinase [Nocardioides flavus (ex Wang et al. 2016)]|uniref:Carbohydrate kinase n=1 Tax=Nocardioides flavus (ex Wang et al. 2016) TaxID=2058780 RepID=A0ABQ3HML2_9ACTN|nr:carbohydrate kinase family protein [Nocardioides flavus (ex Wang et al. 2016)]GHE17887.1 carbohydrate kinase [Nocardioides flavus (ex Wang et al. 2016)]